MFFDVHLSRRTPCQILDYTVDGYTSESEVHLGMDWISYVSCIYGCDGMHAKGVLHPSSVHLPLPARRGLDMGPELRAL